MNPGALRREDALTGGRGTRDLGARARSRRSGARTTAAGARPHGRDRRGEDEHGRREPKAGKEERLDVVQRLHGLGARVVCAPPRERVVDRVGDQHGCVWHERAAERDRGKKLLARSLAACRADGGAARFGDAS